MFLYSIIIRKYFNTVIFMNQCTPNKERKQSLSRLSVISHSNKHLMAASEIKRSGTSLNKRHAQIQQICQERKGKYLVGWGQIPFMSEQNSKTQILNKDVTDFACGEEHLVFVNIYNQAFGIGKNAFGELGNKMAPLNRETFQPIFQNYKIKKVFCTQFCTFFITINQQLFTCGLNNRGQLGIASQKQRICTPTLVEPLSHKTQKQMLDKKQSRSKINSVYYQQLKRSTSSKEFIQEQKPIDYKSDSILQSNENIIDIQGGPFHTVILTNKGRIFYTGNLYKSESLIQDEFTNEFIELNTSKFDKIVSIKSHLTGFCFSNKEGKLYLLGHFGEHLFNEPQVIDKLQVTAYDVNDKGIYIIGMYGEAYFIATNSSKLHIQKISGLSDLKTVYCGLDYTIFMNKSKTLFGVGDNSQNQLGYSISKRNQSTITNLQFTFKSQETVSLKCNNNYVLTMVSNANFVTNLNDNNDVLKLKDLERQNKIIKELLCNKNKKNVKIQTEKQSKFEFSKPINARTFDNSLEIPFQEIKLGKQISEGGYGIIYKATWRKTVVAVKIFKIQHENQNAVRDFISQCHAMEALRHPNIVMFLGACTKPPHFAIVLEYCEGGTLWSLLQKHEELNWQERRKLALGIAKGMNYLHQRPVPILHRDLKSLNILLDCNKRVKLADFGWTKGLENYMTGKIGTYQWMAPEVISGFQYSEKADIYSFGIILWQIASRQAPYRNIPGPQVAQEVMTKELRPQIPKKTPSCFSNLIQRCWSRNPSSRPSFSSLINELQEMTFN